MEIQRADDVVIAEAAAWIARLQGSERTAASDAAFKEWLAADPAHARAFSRATDVWDLIAGAAGTNAAARATPLPSVKRRRVAMSLAAGVAAIALCTGIAMFALRAPAYTTEIGQQRTLTLSDGTRVSLNTDSRLVVHYTASERRVQLARGEGLFEVARDARRSFVVQVGKEQVRALGTKFLIRKEPSAVTVTLIEGRVELTPHARPLRPAASGVWPSQALLLSPGERVTVRSAGVALDRPKVEALTAWRRGEVLFEDVSLLEAVAEINRYGDAQLVIAEPELERLRVSGVFETRNPQEFAQAMARLHQLTVQLEDGQIRLAR